MPDIAMCTDTTCPKRGKCHRYLAVPTEHRQAYFLNSPRVGASCGEFLKTYPGGRNRPLAEADSTNTPKEPPHA